MIIRGRVFPSRAAPTGDIERVESQGAGHSASLQGAGDHAHQHPFAQAKAAAHDPHAPAPGDPTLMAAPEPREEQEKDQGDEVHHTSTSPPP